MDIVTKALLNEYCKSAGLADLSEDKQFEHFTAYLMMAKYLSESFDTNELVTGSGGDTGLDSIGIIVNGALVTDSDAIEELASRNGYIEATFVLVQAETSPGFQTQK